MGKTILLVEDNSDDELLTRTALSKNHLKNEIVVARDGVEALGISSVLGSTPVVILTSSDEQRDVIEGYRLGTNAYVQKPVAFHEFLEATRQLGLFGWS